MSYQRYLSTVLLGAVLSTAILFSAACGLQPVSTIKVKASPELYMLLGTKSFSTNKYISPDSMANMEKGDGSTERRGKVYYYNPPNAENPDQLRYLIHYPLQSFTFDVGNYFGKEGTGAALSRNFDTSIDIPKIEETVQTSVSMYDINTKLLAAFNKDGAPQNTTISPGTSGTVPLPPVQIHFAGFSTVTFDPYQRAALTVSMKSTTVDYAIESAKLHINGEDIDGKLQSEWYSDTKDISFQLNGRTIGTAMSLSITLKILNTTGGDIEITRKLEGRIVRADGVTADLDDIELSEESIGITLPKGFRSAKIGTGSLKLDVKQPDEWQGITIQHKTKVTQEGSGGLALIPAGFTANKMPVDLAGQPLNANPRFAYKPVVKVNLNNAVYTNKDYSPIPADCTISVGKFAEVTLANRDTFNKTQNDPVPPDMKKWIQSIHLKCVTATVKLNNQLPEGNPITVGLKSNIFHIDGSHAFPAGQDEPYGYQSTFSNPPGLDLPIATTSTFDLTTKVLPGSSTGSDAFTLINIETGKPVSFSGNVNFDLDWESMVVKADKEQTTSFPEKGSLSIPMLAQLKKAGIKLNKMPMYFYAGSNSDLFKDTKITLDLSVEEVNEKGITQSSTDLLEGKEKNYPFVPLPADAFEGAEGKEKVKTLKKAVPKPMFTVETLHNALNKYPDGIRFNYTMSMDNGVTITREAYDKAKSGGSAAINVDLLLEFPIGFDVEKPKGNDETEGALELSSFLGKRNPIELVGEDGSFNTVPLTKDQLTVKKLQLNAHLENKSDFKPAFVLRIKDKDNKEKLLEDRKISLANGDQELKFTSDEWDKLKEAGSFLPELYLKMEPGSHRLTKDWILKVTLSVTVAMDIDYEINLGGSRQRNPETIQNQAHDNRPYAQD